MGPRPQEGDAIVEGQEDTVTIVTMGNVAPADNEARKDVAASAAEQEQRREAPESMPESQEDISREKLNPADNQGGKDAAVLVFGRIPKEQFRGHVIPFNWLFRPEALAGPIVYNLGVMICAWSLALCDVGWMFSSLFILVLIFSKISIAFWSMNSSYGVMALLVGVEFVPALASRKVLDSTVQGFLAGFLLQIAVALGAYALKKVTWPRCRYFVAAQIWVIVTQFVPVVVLRVPTDFLPDLVAGMWLPCVSAFYSGAAIRLYMWLNRRFLIVGMPVHAMTSGLYGVSACAQSLVGAGFLPKLEHLQSGDANRIIIRLIGSGLSSFLGDFLFRSFALQRLKFWLETRLGRQPPALTIEPEMDSVMRMSFSVNYLVLVIIAITVVMTLPSGNSFSTNAFVWVSLGVRMLLTVLCDVVVVALNRSNNPVPGETFFGARLRLQQPCQSWARCQCDGGRAFEAAKASAEGREVVPEPVGDEAREILAVKWSSHGYFDDRRMVVILTAWPIIVIFGNAMANIYTQCGVWVHMSSDGC